MFPGLRKKREAGQRARSASYSYYPRPRTPLSIEGRSLTLAKTKSNQNLEIRREM